jgi:bifunctional enzyme CysN/CysC
MNATRLLLCGGNGTGKHTLAARLQEATGYDRLHITLPLSLGAKGNTLRLATGATTSDAAVIVVDARVGMTQETRRHTHVLTALGCARVVIAVNKMDLVHHSEEVFTEVRRECIEVATRLGADSAPCIPISAAHAENIRQSAGLMPWYAGPTLLESLERGGELAAIQPEPQEPESADRFEASIVWTGDRPMLQSRSYPMRVGMEMVSATVTPLKYRIDASTLQPAPAKTLDCGDIGVANLQLAQPIAFHRNHRYFTLLDDPGGEVVGVGLLHFALRRSQNLRWQALDIDKHARAALMGQAPCLIWFTGLSGAGKSTIANLVEKRLHALGRHTYLLDGDNVRHGLNKDLGFTDTDRVENIRRVAEVARLMVDAGLIVLVSFISPFRSERRMARALVGDGEFVEVFVDTPLEVAEARDPKGLYQKARRGELRNFTGLDSPYEVPEHPEVRLDTTRLTPEESAEEILGHLRRAGLVGRS